MKKILALIKSSFAYGVFLAISCSVAINAGAQSPVLYGTTIAGGTYNHGTIFRFDASNDLVEVVHSFNDTDGSLPRGALVYDSLIGLFYGLTSGGGMYNGGTLYSFNPVNDSLKVLWDFGNNSDGAYPQAELVYFTGTGLYYGTTYEGGKGAGTIFAFNPLNDSENVVWNFENGNDGEVPNGDLLYDTATRLFYATTQNGGINHGYGTIISFDPIADTESVVWSFGKEADGAYPIRNLVYGADGHLLYGVTVGGGKSGAGTIYSFNPANDSAIVLWNFVSGTGAFNPQTGLIYNDSNGLFYGVTPNGGFTGTGTIYSFNPADDSEKVVWNLAGYPNNDGAQPWAPLLYDPVNHLYYGTTTVGSSGTIYSFNPADNSQNALYGLMGDTILVGSEAPLTLYTSVSAGVTAVNSAPIIRVYPNPSEGVYTLAGLSVGQTLEVDNCLGQKIRSLIANQPVQQLNIDYVPNGIYLLRVFTADGIPEYETKVIKN